MDYFSKSETNKQPTREGQKVKLEISKLEVSYCILAVTTIVAVTNHCAVIGP